MDTMNVAIATHAPDTAAKLTWNIRCRELPTVIRHCKKCGQARSFVCSGRFRVNAQKQLLDVWLIYKCPECDDTWNAAIFSRVSPRSIQRDVLDGLHDNDAALVRRYALDGEVLHRCGAELELPALDTDGDIPAPGRRTLIELCPECALPMRISAILRAHLGLSRSELTALAAAGRVRLAQGGDILRAKLGGGALVEVEL